MGSFVGMLKKDMVRLGLLSAKKLMLADNLGFQREEDFIKGIEMLAFEMSFGPPNGTDTWQAVDHGVGRV